MSMRDFGASRRERRQGGVSGVEVASEHFDEMVGSTEFNIYRHPNQKIKGYEALKTFLESQGCEVLHLGDAPAPVGRAYETMRVTIGGEQLPVPLLRRAHNWAHQRNLLHMFHKKG